MARDALSQNVRQQFFSWTLVGPFFAPSGDNLWFPVDLDGARAIPQAFSLNGKPVTVTRCRMRPRRSCGELDIRTQRGVYGFVWGYQSIGTPSDQLDEASDQVKIIGKADDGRQRERATKVGLEKPEAHNPNDTLSSTKLTR